METISSNKYALQQAYLLYVMKVDLKHQRDQKDITCYFQFDSNEDMTNIEKKLKNAKNLNILHSLQNERVYPEEYLWENQKTHKLSVSHPIISQSEDEEEDHQKPLLKQKQIEKAKRNKRQKELKLKIAKLQKQISQWKQSFQKMEMQLSQRITQLKSDNQSLKTNLDKEYSQKINNLKQEHTNQMNLLTNKYKRELSQMNENHQIEIRDIIRDRGVRYLTRQLQAEKTHYNELSEKYDKLLQRRRMGGYVPPQQNFYNRE